MQGERFRSARRRAGLNQRQVAAKVGVSAQAISKYERDMDVPSSPVLIALARALDVSVEYFFRRRSVRLAAPCYRKGSSLRKKDEAAIQARIEDWLERYIDVEDLLGVSMAFQLFRDSSWPVSVKDVEDAEGAADRLREEWGLGISPIGSLIDVLEGQGIRVYCLEAHEKFSGCTFTGDDGVPVMAANCGLSGDRVRLSLAHELGHLVLKPAGRVDEEKASFRFAAAFLVPREAAFAELGKKRSALSPYELHQLKHKYGMSMQAWVYRAKDLGIIPSSQAARLFREFRTRGWHREEPGDQLPPEEPKRMKTLIMRAYEEGIISETRASELLGKPLEDFGHEEASRHGGFPVPVCC